MTTVLSIPSPDNGIWYLGPLPIRGYALCIIAGIIAAIWIGERRWVAALAAKELPREALDEGERHSLPPFVNTHLDDPRPAIPGCCGPGGKLHQHRWPGGFRL